MLVITIHLVYLDIHQINENQKEYMGYSQPGRKAETIIEITCCKKYLWLCLSRTKDTGWSKKLSGNDLYLAQPDKVSFHIVLCITLFLPLAVIFKRVWRKREKIWDPQLATMGGGGGK